jgi:hypothetical protein
MIAFRTGRHAYPVCEVSSDQELTANRIDHNWAFP